DFESITGVGIVGKIDAQVVKLGSEKILPKDTNPGFLMMAQSFGPEVTVLFVVINDRLAALIGVADAIKPTARAAIQELHRKKIEVVMITGDNRATAQSVAAQ